LDFFNDKLIFFDGGMGSLLQIYGLAIGEGSDMQNLVNPEAVKKIHREYVAAGADVITANTLGCYSCNYSNYEELIRAGVGHAKEAIQNAGRPIYTALDMGPTGELLEPMGSLSFDDCYKMFLQSAQIGAEAGADLILIETMTDLYEMKAAVLAAKTTGLPVAATMTFDKNGRSLTGSTPQIMALLMDSLEVDIIGMNCGYGPNLYEGLGAEIVKYTNKPILIQPNAGLPEMIDGSLKYSMTAKDFSSSMLNIYKRLGSACLLGGCCGTTPEHIKAMTDIINNAGFVDKNDKAQADENIYVCSASKIVALRDANIVKAADIDEAIDLSFDADIIEINIGSSPEYVKQIQELVRTPLSLKADSDEVLLEAVRLYNGCPLITTCNKDFYPKLKRYGARFVCPI